jgi:hypothetical protein
VFERRVVEFSSMSDNRVGSAEGGPMARSGRLLTEAQWQKIAPLLPKSRKNRKGGRPWIENRRVLEGDSLDSAERRKMAGLAGEISASFDLLETVGALG